MDTEANQLKAEGASLLGTAEMEEKSTEEALILPTGLHHLKGRSSVLQKMDHGVSRRPRLLLFLFLCSLICNAWLLLTRQSESLPQNQRPKSLTGLAERPLVARKEGFWSPEWDGGMSNTTEVDALWKKAVSGFGIVALDQEWALEQGLAPSRAWKLDRSKGVYTFTAYHALHCARSLRILYQKLVNGEPFEDKWGPHSFHCFEIIREELMCSASDTLYASRLNETRDGILRIGEGETRQCTDWEYLRDWAGEHTAGYTIGDYDDEGSSYEKDAPMTDGWFISPALRQQDV